MVRLICEGCTCVERIRAWCMQMGAICLNILGVDNSVFMAACVFVCWLWLHFMVIILTC